MTYYMFVTRAISVMLTSFAIEHRHVQACSTRCLVPLACMGLKFHWQVHSRILRNSCRQLSTPFSDKCALQKALLFIKHCVCIDTTICLLTVGCCGRNSETQQTNTRARHKTLSKKSKNPFLAYSVQMLHFWLSCGTNISQCNYRSVEFSILVKHSSTLRNKGRNLSNINWRAFCRCRRKPSILDENLQ